jgi:hypothetical protein
MILTEPLECTDDNFVILTLPLSHKDYIYITFSYPASRSMTHGVNIYTVNCLPKILTPLFKGADFLNVEYVTK